jgi:hypothetical protein
LQRLELGTLLRRRPRTRPRVDLVLLYPVPQCLAGPDAELLGHRLQSGRLIRVAVAHLGDHAHRAAAELKGVPGRSCHDSILSCNRVSIRTGPVQLPDGGFRVGLHQKPRDGWQSAR